MAVNLDELVKCEVCKEMTHRRADGSELCPKHYPDQRKPGPEARPPRKGARIH